MTRFLNHYSSQELAVSDNARPGSLLDGQSVPVNEECVPETEPDDPTQYDCTELNADEFVPYHLYEAQPGHRIFGTTN